VGGEVREGRVVTGGVRGDVRKRAVSPAPVKLTAAEYEALCEASWSGRNQAWVSRAEVAVVESIIAARLAGA
jgi:hypothetical protein